MINKFNEFSTQAFLEITNENYLQNYRNSKTFGNYAFIWSGDCRANFIIDGLPISLDKHSILSLTPVQHFRFLDGENLRIYIFNREFYCIKDHDKEVGCAGLLFFGNNFIPIVELDKKERTKFNLLHQVFLDEMATTDTIQAEMLRMLMARFIIKTTRLLKNSEQLNKESDAKTELYRQFNFLVENHFRKEHGVKFYADALNKSPKTLSNSFNKLNKSPLKIIHDRLILETKRLLTYTNKSAKEIAYEIGFDDASHLSRLFKKHTSHTLSHFKKEQISL